VPTTGGGEKYLQLDFEEVDGRKVLVAWNGNSLSV
jgi:hypothetical protein